MDVSPHIALAEEARTIETSAISNLAASRWTTFFVLLFEMFEVAVLVGILDFYAAQAQEQNPFIDHGQDGMVLIAVFAGVQYVLFGFELVVRHRSQRRGLTIPIGLLPLGRGLRFVLIAVVCALALVPKLTLYFVYLTIGIPFLVIMSRLGITAGARFIDQADVVFEPIERGTNHLFNLLHFNKIEVTGNGFNSIFNLWLSLWCLNN